MDNIEKIKLNIHTNMSKLDGVIKIEELVKYAMENKYDVIGISDFNSVASFPCMYNQTKKIENLKVVYGAEVNVKYAGVFKVKIVVRNNTGLKNLYKIITRVNNQNLDMKEVILRSELKQLREGLLIGSSAIEGELFFENIQLSEKQMKLKMDWYDYVIVNPFSMAKELIGNGKMFLSEEEYNEYVKKIILVAKQNEKIVIASEDVYALNEEDTCVKKILDNSLDNGTEFNRKILSEEDMFKYFSYLGEKLSKEIIVENVKKIISLVKKQEIIKEGIVIPRLENDTKLMKNKVYENVFEIYGSNVPMEIVSRIEEELKIIISTHNATNFFIAAKIMEKSKENGYIVGTRGLVGSSFIANMLGITNINPLPPHYICQKCKKSIFELEGIELSKIYSSGYDMDDYTCEECLVKMNKEGQNILSSSFARLEEKSMPDIILNFHSDERGRIKEYVEEIIEEEEVYLAGYMKTIGEKRAHKDVKKYLEKTKKHIGEEEYQKILDRYLGIVEEYKFDKNKIVITPAQKEIYDFTPVNISEDKRVTHFENESLKKTLFQIEALGHSDLDVLKMLQDMTGVNVMNISFEDEKIISIFSSPKELGIKKEKINHPNGMLGITQFSKKSVNKILENIKVKTFSDLIKIEGLVYGTNIWNDNAKSLIEKRKTYFENLITCKEDIFIHLLEFRIEEKKIFEITEFLCKGFHNKDFEKKNEYEKIMKKAGVETWFIESCFKVSKVLPKSHLINYVMNAYRIAYFKIYYPLEFYATFLNLNIDNIDIEMIFKNEFEINKMIKDIKEKKTKSKDDIKKLNILKVILEMTLRGFDFLNVDLKKSDDSKFVVCKKNKKIILPKIFLSGY